MWKRFLAGLCAAALLVVFIQSYAAGEEWDANIIFLALNDSPVPLSDSTMPTLMGMVLSLRGTGESLRARKMILASHSSPAA